jgi:hypothetical protein
VQRGAIVGGIHQRGPLWGGSNIASAGVTGYSQDAPVGRVAKKVTYAHDIVMAL